MLHSKPQGNQPSGSEEEDFSSFLPHMSMSAILVMWPGQDYINFVSFFARRLHMKFKWNWHSSFRGETFWKSWHQTCDLLPRSSNDLDLQNSIGVKIWCIIVSQSTVSNQKMHFFNFFPIKSLRDQIWHCHKIGQGQSRVIIYINIEGLTPQMLHCKFQGNQPSGSGEDFLRF